MNFIKREKLTSPRVWTSLIPNIEFTQMELLQSEQERKYRIELEETGWNKVIVPATSAVTKVVNGEWVPKAARKCIQRGKIILPSAVVCGLGSGCLWQTQFMIFHDF